MNVTSLLLIERERGSEEAKRRKRGRPPKSRISTGSASDPTAIQQQPPRPPQQIAQQHQIPQLQTHGIGGIPQSANVAQPQASPAKPTPTKPVVKALPTVRDHTTDQLTAEGDEYVPREYDEAGEKKVSPTGRPLDGREYRCRTFLVPNRGDKLFMLATECARVLSYRDSYLLFNKNRSLYKIIASQAEKDDLIHQEILPYSYRSRQIAIVTAKSMFRQFGSRVIQHGRRVRDDYWEAKARKQGFTEEDLAGEKRPGGAKAARDAAAAEAANNAALNQHPDIIYSNAGHVSLDAHGHPQGLQSGLGGPMVTPLAPLPMINLAPQEDIRSRDYGNIPRPRQEITGQAYQDRTTPSSNAEIMSQATQAKDFNSIVNNQRAHRHKMNDDHWRREVPVSTPQQHHAEPSPAISQSLQSPHMAAGGMMNPSHQSMLQHPSSQMMAPQQYSQPLHQQSVLAQSPSRNVPQQIRSEHVAPQRSSSLNYHTASGSQTSPYSYQSHAWGQPPPAPQQSPLTTHHPGLPHYSQQASQQQSQTQQHAHSHPSQSPHLTHSPHQPPPLQHAQPNASMHGGMSYQGMPNITSQPSYGGGSNYRSYPQQQPTQQQQQQQQQQHQQQQGHSQSPQSYMQSTSQAGGQGWAGSAPSGAGPQHGQSGQGWQGYP